MFFIHSRCEYCDKPSKYQDKNNPSNVVSTYTLCDHHVFKDKGYFYDSYYVEEEVGIIEVTLEESKVNARCERCQTTQWQCKHGLITTSTHYLRLCGWHYRKFKYRCPQHNTSLTKAWKICIQANLQTDCPQIASCEVCLLYTFSKLIALHCAINKNYYKNSKEHIRISCAHCTHRLAWVVHRGYLSFCTYISMYAWHKRITSPRLHWLKRQEPHMLWESYYGAQSEQSQPLRRDCSGKRGLQGQLVCKMRFSGCAYTRTRIRNRDTITCSGVTGTIA